MNLELLQCEAASANFHRDEARRLRRLLWAAVITNGGTLNVSEISLDAYDRDDFVMTQAIDPMRNNFVLIAKRKSAPPSDRQER